MTKRQLILSLEGPELLPPSLIDLGSVQKPMAKKCINTQNKQSFLSVKLPKNKVAVFQNWNDSLIAVYTKEAFARCFVPG